MNNSFFTYYFFSFIKNNYSEGGGGDNHIISLEVQKGHSNSVNNPGLWEIESLAVDGVKLKTFIYIIHSLERVKRVKLVLHTLTYTIAVSNFI